MESTTSDAAVLAMRYFLTSRFGSDLLGVWDADLWRNLQVKCLTRLDWHVIYI